MYFKRKRCNELSLEFLQLRRWFRKLCYFYKFYKNESPQYLFKLVSLRHFSYTTRNAENIPLFKTKYNFSKKFFFSLSCYQLFVLTITFEKSEALVFLKIISWNLSGQPPIVYLIIMTIIEEWYSLEDCALALIICGNTNSNRVFKIH